MTPAFHQICGDVLHVGPRLAPCSVHAVIADPPYLIGFMGREWETAHRGHTFEQDHARELDFLGWCRFKPSGRPWRRTSAERAILWQLRWIRDAYRALVPGGHLAAWGGAKMAHQLATACELAGFEILPELVTATGTAMLQGGAVGKQIDRMAGAEREDLGPSAYEARGRKTGAWTRHPNPTGYNKPGGTSKRRLTVPATDLGAAFDGYGTRIRDMVLGVVVLARKPPEGSYAASAAKWGYGGMNVDGCRVETADKLTGSGATTGTPGLVDHRPWMKDGEAIRRARARKRQAERKSQDLGRAPGNVILVDGAAEKEVGRQSGETTGSTPGTNRRPRPDGWRPKTGRTHGDPGGTETERVRDTGTAARYFTRLAYSDRANERERRRGLESWLWVGDPQHPEGWQRIRGSELHKHDPADVMVGTNHPALKPLRLTEWVARLLLPPMHQAAVEIRQATTGSAGKVWIPFSGVGSEVIGAMRAGWPEVIGCEMSASYVEQAAARIRAWGPYEVATPATAARPVLPPLEADEETQGVLW